MKKTFLLLAMGFSMFCIGITSCSNANKTESEQNEEKAVYQCPMDCEKGKTYENPGQCPVCGMDLEKAEMPHSHDSTHHVD